MTPGRWRIDLGVIAVVIWTAVVGFPVLAFHVSAAGVSGGERLHAAVLFVVSQVAVFWLVGRPRSYSQDNTLSRTPAVASSPVVSSLASGGPTETAAPAAVEEIRLAELVDPAGAEPPIAGDSARDGSWSVSLTITNYLASSRTRIVTVEPGRTTHSLRPHQSLTITAIGESRVPILHLLESDGATQVTCSHARQVHCVRKDPT